MVSVRLTPKLRYLADVAARVQRRTLSSYVEGAVKYALSRRFKPRRWRRNMNGTINLGTKEAERFGFTPHRFKAGSYLWREGTTIIISCIASVHPHHGDFRRLVEEIRRQGFRVAIPTPLGRMVGIVERSGYQRVVETTEQGDACEVWFLEPS